MTLSNRKPLFLALALTLAAPLAFAQSTTPQAQPTTTESSTQSTTTTQSTDPAAQPTTTQSTTESSTSSTMPTGTQGDATAATQDDAAAAAQDATAATQGATPATSATAEDPATPQKKNWSDLDVDKNGSLSVTEAASVQSLAKAFTEADANADGQLTQDEYKAYLETSEKGGAAKSDSGG